MLVIQPLGNALNISLYVLYFVEERTLWLMVCAGLDGSGAATTRVTHQNNDLMPSTSTAPAASVCHFSQYRSSCEISLNYSV